MKKVAFYTLGCKVNQYESEAIKNIFVKDGYKEVDFNNVADVYIVNTCTVTSLSDKKSRQMMRKAKKLNTDAILVVMGCYSQVASEEVEKIPEVDIVVGTNERKSVLKHVKDLQQRKVKINVVKDIMKTKQFEEMELNSYQEKTRAFVKIQEGCNQYCSYCIIPYARGSVRSRKPENIISEVKRLGEQGFKEIVLTGIHIASYGKDTNGPFLLELLKKVHEIDEIERIRLGSIEPTIITEDFVQGIEEMEKLCPHFHISLQSGCDETLMRMNRKYTTSEFKKVVSNLKNQIKDIAITTDIMVGFPGETDEEFKKTYDFLEEIEFSDMHIFKYSRRKGTPAATYPNQVLPEVKEKRSKILNELNNRAKIAFNKKYEGEILPVLLEQEVKNKKGYIEGMTPNHIKVMCKGNIDLKGKIQKVNVLNSDVDYCYGIIV